MTDKREICKNTRINQYNPDHLKDRKTLISKSLSIVHNSLSEKSQKSSFANSYFSSFSLAQTETGKSLQKLGSISPNRNSINGLYKNKYQAKSTEKLKQNNDSSNIPKKTIIKKDIKLSDKKIFQNNKIIEPNKVSELKNTKNIKIKLSKEIVEQNEKVSKDVYYPDSNNYIGISKEIQISEAVKELNISLKQKPYKVDEIIEKLKLFFLICPIINEFKNTKILLEQKDFDIFNKRNEKKFLFEINLVNLISIINLVYTITENVNQFNKCLDKLNINFSFVRRDANSNKNEIDFLLLAPISQTLYNDISTYGKNLFPLGSSNYHEAVRFINSIDKQNFDEGYFFEQYTAMNLLDKIGEEKCKINSRIIYYLKKDTVLNLMKCGIINAPELFSFPVSNTKSNGESFEGYNEMDICFTMHEKDVIIKENENLKFFSNNTEKNSITLRKNIMYIIEVKLSIDTIIGELEKTKKHFKRFSEAFQNVRIAQKINLSFKEAKLLLICNRSILEVKKSILKNELRDDLVYTNPQIGMNFILALNDRIKNLKRNITSIDNKISEKEHEIKSIKNLIGEKDNQISSLITRINNLERSNYYNVYEECRNNIKNFDYVKPGLIISISKKKQTLNLKGIESWESLFDSFEKLSKFYLDIKKLENEETLYKTIEPFIGITIEKEEDINTWKAIKERIAKKANGKSMFSIYYKGLLDFLYGKKYLNNKNGEMDLDLKLNNSNTRRYIKKLILFLEVSEKNKDLNQIVSKFQAVTIYICYKIGIPDKILTLFELQKNENEAETEQTIMKLISSLNKENKNN